MRTFFLSLLILIVPIGAARAEGFGKLTVDEVKAKLHQKNVYIFDNNDPEVYKDAHLPGAKWLHPSEYNPKDLPADKNATLIFYCHNEH